MKIICLLKRKPGLSREDFMAYYEQRHVKLTAKMLPFFSDYRRNYIDPDTSYGSRHLDNQAPAEPPYDVITEMSFSSRDMYDKLIAALGEPTIGRLIAEDEDNVFDRSAMTIYVVDERIGT